MLRLLLPLALLLLTSLVAHGQSQLLRVSGYVRGDTVSALANAVVAFVDESDSTRIYPAVCDEKGYYQQELPAGSYLYWVHYMGVKHSQANNRVALLEQPVRLPDITVNISSQELEQVVVTATRPYVSYKGGNAVYNLRELPTVHGGSVLDGITKLPGVSEGANGGLSMYGFYNLTVAVNKRILRMSPEELQAYLGSLSVAEVESVEVIRHPGPEYGKVDAVLNITMRRNPDEGFSTFIAGDVRWQRMFSELARLRFNYNWAKVRTYVGYQFYDMRSKDTLSSTIGSNTSVVDPNRGHNVQLGAEWQINKENRLGGRGYGSFVNERMLFNGRDRTMMDRMVGSGMLYYGLDTERWDWDIDGEYLYSQNAFGYYTQEARTGGNADRFHYARGNTRLMWQVIPRLSLTLGGSYTAQWYQTEHESGTLTGYTEKNASAYLSARFRMGGVGLNGGVQLNRDERNIIVRNSAPSPNVDRNDTLWRWQPYFGASYDFWDDHRVYLNFDTYYRRPNYRDILPFSSSSGLLERVGNPLLTNSTRYQLSLGYSYLRAALLEVNLSHEDLPVVEYIHVPPAGRPQILLTNLDRTRYMRVLLGAPYPIKWRNAGVEWMLALYGAWQWQEDRGRVNDMDLTHRFHSFYFQHKQTLSLPKQWYIEASVEFYSPLYAGVYHTRRPQWWVDASVTKRLKEWRFALEVWDIFNTNIAQGEIVGLVPQVFFNMDWMRPRIRLVVSYTFGSWNKVLRERSSQGESRLRSSGNEGMSLGN